MAEYEFTLKFAIPEDIGREALEDRLFGHGCDDALIGTGQPGRLALAFARDADSAEQAVESAIADVTAAVPGARLVEADPDLVGVSDVADRLDFSRQNMRKLIQTHRASFPLPVHEGRVSLWHLVDVLDWFVERQGRVIDGRLRDIARTSMRINVAREVRRLEGAGGELPASTQAPESPRAGTERAGR